MTYNSWNEIWSYSVTLGVIVWFFLAIRLFFGVIKKNGTIKSSLKYIVNSATFLFVAFVFFSFAIVNTSPGENNWVWVKANLIEWFLEAILITLLLATFNFLYQIYIEGKQNFLELVVFALADLTIMVYGIMLGIGIGLSK